MIRFVLLADAVLHRYVVYVCESCVELIIVYLNSLCAEDFWLFFFISVFPLESREVIIFYNISFVNYFQSLMSKLGRSLVRITH